MLRERKQSVVHMSISGPYIYSLIVIFSGLARPHGPISEHVQVQKPCEQWDGAAASYPILPRRQEGPDVHPSGQWFQGGRTRQLWEAENDCEGGAARQQYGVGTICKSCESGLRVGMLTLTVLVTTIYAQWEGMGDVGSARYEPALLPPCPTIKVLSYSN